LDLENHWLAGFSDADASFQIKILTRNEANPRTEVRLAFQIDQKDKDILVLIQKFLGGNIGYRKTQDTYYYNSTSFGSARKVTKYFDYYHLLSNKHVNYLKWRKAYRLIQNKEHRPSGTVGAPGGDPNLKKDLSPGGAGRRLGVRSCGIEKIKKLKNSMNSFNKEQLEL
jgi:hypothetical protein